MAPSTFNYDIFISYRHNDNKAPGGAAGEGWVTEFVNHLTTEKLKARMGGKTYFIDHAYAALHLDGRWVKAVPAFNIELCRRFGVRPTEFDGRSDALYQEFDAHDRRHMEYVKDHGVWSDFPYEKVAADFRAFCCTTSLRVKLSRRMIPASARPQTTPKSDQPQGPHRLTRVKGV